MGDFTEIAKQFVEFYYATFDTNRTGLKPLYRPGSMLTFESDAILGDTAIVDKLVSLPFQKVKHAVGTMDAQPSINNGIVVLVTGALLVDDEERPMNYSQVFQLLPEGQSYYVHNDLFKLIFG